MLYGLVGGNLYLYTKLQDSIEYDTSSVSISSHGSSVGTVDDKIIQYQDGRISNVTKFMTVSQLGL
jgi:hypothetical protein